VRRHLGKAQPPSIRWPLLTLIVFLLGFSAVSHDHMKPPSGDEYENYAFSLWKWGVYGRATQTEVAPEPDAGRAPLYPAFLAGVIELSPAYRDMVACYVDKNPDCDWSKATVLQWAQRALMVGALLILFFAATAIGAGSWMAALATALTAPFLLKYVGKYPVSEAVALPLVAVLTYALCLWYARRVGWPALVLAGIAIALLALSRLAYVYFVPFLAIAILIIPRRHVAFREGLATRLVGALVLTVTVAAVLAPWYARNYDQVGRLVIGESAGNEVLATRVMYNRMTLEEGIAAILIWLPNPMPKLAQALFPAEVTEKFDFKNPEGFRQKRHQELRKLESTHSKDEVRRLLLDEMRAHPVRHTLMSIPFAVRGLRQVWLFVPLAVGLLVVATRRGAWWVWGLAVFPILNLLFHAGLTHFRERYGLPMIFGLAPLTALALTMLLHRFWFERRAGEREAREPLL